MQPRLKTSKKWSPFPKELALQIEGVIRENFGSELGSLKLVIEGRIYGQEIVLRLGLREKDSIRQTNFEVSVDYVIAEGKVLESIHLALDGAGAMLEEFLKDGEAVRFPKTWLEQKFHDQQIFIQSSAVNTDLEAEADRLLGLSEGLLNAEEDESEDPPSEADRDERPGERSPPKKRGPIH